MTNLRRALVALTTLVVVLILAPSSAHAQDALTAAVQPSSGPPGSSFTISGAVPESCGSAVVHRTSQPALGQGQTPVQDGSYAVTLGIPARVPTGVITIDAYCLEQPDLATSVSFEVTEPASPSTELAETGSMTAPLVVGAVGIILVGLRLVRSPARDPIQSDRGPEHP